MRSQRSVTSIPARVLGRDDRVILDADEMPYLVDTVSDLPDGTVRVTYSSGDVIDYAPDASLTVLD